MEVQDYFTRYLEYHSILSLQDGMGKARRLPLDGKESLQISESSLVELFGVIGLALYKDVRMTRHWLVCIEPRV